MVRAIVVEIKIFLTHFHCHKHLLSHKLLNMGLLYLTAQPLELTLIKHFLKRDEKIPCGSASLHSVKKQPQLCDPIMKKKKNF